MLNNTFHNPYRIEYASSFNERLRVRRSVKSRIFPGCCKIITAILLLCMAMNTNAAQLEDILAKETQPQPAKQAGTKRDQQAVNEGRKKGKKKDKGVFIPSDKVSSDLPVSFPADI